MTFNPVANLRARSVQERPPSRKQFLRLIYYSLYGLASPALGNRAVIRSREGLVKHGLERLVILPDFPQEEVLQLQVPAAAAAALLRGPARSAGASDDQPDISIVIPVFNKSEFTMGCLASIAFHTSTYSFETIVIDDCSTDDTAEIIRKVGWVNYNRHDKNVGFIGSCNDGLALAKGRYVVFLNNDTVVTHGWLDELRRTFEIRPDAGLVGCKLIYPNGTLQEAGGVVWQDASAANCGRSGDAENPAYNYLREVDYISGASIMIPRDLVDRLGGFDTYYNPAYYEDTDLAFRVRQMGLRVFYQPLSTVIHQEGATSGVDLADGVKAYQVVNKTKFAERWRETLNADTHFAAGIDRLWTEHRLLFLEETTPTPDQDAGSVASVETMRCLQHLGYQVTFLTVDPIPRNKYTDDLQREGIEVLYAPYGGSIGDHLTEAGERYDAVLMHRVGLAWQVYKDVRRLAPRARLIFMVADLHHLREGRRGELSGWSTVVQEWAEELKKRELAVIAEADCTLVHSAYEKEYLAQMAPGRRVENLGWVVRQVARSEGFETRADLMFIGGFRHPPNVDAVEHFLDAIWPKVASALPAARFFIVGSNAPESWRDLKHDRVQLVGFVDDLGPWLNRCRLSVVPLRFGAGFKGKIATSLASGLPLVTSATGAEGMGLEDGVNALIADDADAFAERVVALYTDPKLWSQLSDNGMRFIADTFSPESAERVLKRALDPRE